MQSLGSGHKYFDITQPHNNLSHQLPRSVDSMSQEMITEHLHKLGMYCFYGEIKQERMKYQTLTIKLIDGRETVPELTYRCIAHPQLHHYTNNRDNLLWNLCYFSQLKSPQDRHLFEDLVRLLIKSGLHPLEKDSRFGINALGAHLSFNTDIKTLEFLSTLHPEMLTDFSDSGQTVMQCALGYNKSIAVVKWLAENIPATHLRENIQSIEKKVKKSARAKMAVETMTIRIEKNLLETGLSASDNKNKLEIKL